MGVCEVKPVYVLYGTDEFLQVENRRGIISRVIGSGDPQTSVRTFEPDVELSDVLDELRTVPFLSPHRVVVVTDADDFVSDYRGQLEKYLSSPSGTSSLILSVSSWAKNTRLYKMVEKIGEAIDCTGPDRKDAGRYLRELAAKRGKKIGPQAAELMLEWCGEDLGTLDNEIEKLSLYIGDRKEIAPDDVAALVAAAAGPRAFALTNAITAGDTSAALKALAGSLTRRGEEFRVLGMIAWHLRRAMQVHQEIAKGAGPAEACRSARIYGGQREFLQMLRRRPRTRLRKDFRCALAADLDMKSGVEPVAALQQLVVGLCSQ
jgi:DNA polymerase-3 subunit delta